MKGDRKRREILYRFAELGGVVSGEGKRKLKQAFSRKGKKEKEKPLIRQDDEI